MILAPAPSASRRDIYYWKCDRPAAFYGTEERRDPQALQCLLLGALQLHYSGKNIELRHAGGQGNHITWIARVDHETDLFVRVEDGPERDDYIEVESHLLDSVRTLGIPTPRVYLVDASRKQVPFAWQVMECIPCPDLNQLHKQGRLDLDDAAQMIGAAVARWQGVPVIGFGPFDSAVLRAEGKLAGFHECYEDYFRLNLEKHLRFLVDAGFFSAIEAQSILDGVAQHQSLLDLKQGCLVHKDLALWNILGTETEITAFIDWDDAISGDPMDDLSLLGCFYDGAVLARALEGYASVRALPKDYRRRFWLHLLRNMIVKAVIRVGAGYFERTDGFFLIGPGSSGADLKTFTRARLFRALEGLRTDLEIDQL
jgi:aminoglycoside phosphotransferase (APT) family kinase protein